MKKIFGSLLGALLGILVFIGGSYLEFFGIYHSFSKHGVKDGLISVFIPPYGWYRAIEYWWHDDYAGVKWDEKLSSDLQAIISIINAVEERDPQIQAKIPKAINDLSIYFKSYPKDKLEILKEGVWLYIEWNDSISNDFNKYFVNSIKKRRENFTKSQQTLDLYVKASKYSKVKETIDRSEEAILKVLETMRPEASKSIPTDMIEKMPELLKIKTDETYSKCKTIYEGAFNEKYPQR